MYVCVLDRYSTNENKKLINFKGLESHVGVKAQYDTTYSFFYCWPICDCQFG